MQEKGAILIQEAWGSDFGTSLNWDIGKDKGSFHTSASFIRLYTLWHLSQEVPVVHQPFHSGQSLMTSRTSVNWALGTKATKVTHQNSLTG